MVLETLMLENLIGTSVVTSVTVSFLFLLFNTKRGMDIWFVTLSLYAFFSISNFAFLSFFE